MKKYVLYLLHNYKEIVATIEMLKLQLHSFQGVTDEEAIEALTFEKQTDDRIQTGKISEKTARAGLLYKEYAKRINTETKSEIMQSIAPLENEIKMLETAVEGLTHEECSVIKGLYFAGRPLPQVAGELAISERRVRYVRDTAIKRLSSIYGRFQKLSFGGVVGENQTKQ